MFFFFLIFHVFAMFYRDNLFNLHLGDIFQKNNISTFVLYVIDIVMITKTNITGILLVFGRISQKVRRCLSRQEILKPCECQFTIYNLSI